MGVRRKNPGGGIFGGLFSTAPSLGDFQFKKKKSNAILGILFKD